MLKGRGSPGSRLQVQTLRMLEQAGQCLAFLGCVEACSMGKWILGTLLLLQTNRTNHPPSLKLPLIAVLGLGGSSSTFSSLSWDMLPWPQSEIETEMVKCEVLQGGCGKAPRPSRLRTGRCRC